MTAGRVSQHQAVPVVIPVAGDGLASAVPRATQTATIASYNDHDADGTIHALSGTLAQRPAFGTAGRKYTTTDSPRQVWLDTGTAWVQLDYASSSVTNSDALFYLFATRI